MIPDNVKPLALQAILFFMLQKWEGKTRSEAIEAFVNGKLCKAFGDNLTMANVWGFAEAAGYVKDE